MANPVPEGFHTITPHLVIKNAKAAIEFYKKAFGAEEVLSMPGPDGKLMHAEIKIGDSRLMIGEECPDMGISGPSGGKSPVSIHCYVRDVDAFFKRAVSAGAKVTMPVDDMFWGDRYGKLEDPYGHHWSVATHKEDVTPEECGRRAAKFFESQG
jgi:uncharacterized glyoxalase superfamily protein PhnB